MSARNGSPSSNVSSAHPVSKLDNLLLQSWVGRGLGGRTVRHGCRYLMCNEWLCRTRTSLEWRMIIHCPKLVLLRWRTLLEDITIFWEWGLKWCIID
jgi:hypothetical protein